MKKPNQAKKSWTTIQDAKKLNRTWTDTHMVPPRIMAGWADPLTGEHGLKGLIRTILKAHGAISPRCIEDANERAAAIAKAMFTEEIIAEVQRRFTAGTCRYPPPSIKKCLSTEMFRSGEVCKIQLEPKEDVYRDCCKPRCKWYLPGF